MVVGDFISMNRYPYSKAEEGEWTHPKIENTVCIHDSPRYKVKAKVRKVLFGTSRSDEIEFVVTYHRGPPPYASHKATLLFFLREGEQFRSL